MSLRDSLLVVLTLGPAYGYQLHAEVVERTRRSAALNPGQVYSTLDRLARDELLRPAGTTHDGLPLYALTDAGHGAAANALATPRGPDFAAMVDHVLLAQSVPGADVAGLIAAYRTVWRKPAGAAPTEPHRLAARRAQDELAKAAHRWLDALPRVQPWAPRADRPRRGRGLRQAEEPR
ncbi:PadR family transcriptional regulator [Lysobacter korlensis]|uniref:PadR family transcriptional regulator n=1 Tax=Lysobacter korlensis TaxID=553636 RepID=A0ABV6RQE2_9GAMM